MATRRPAVPTSAQMRAQVLSAIAERLTQAGLTQKEVAAQLGLALLVIWPVTVETILRQNGANVSTEDDLIVGGNRRRRDQGESGRCDGRKNHRRVEATERCHAT